MKVLIASDHAGFSLKSQLMSSFPEIEWLDLGPFSDTSVDYPDYSQKVACEIEKVERAQQLAGIEDFYQAQIFGVLICSTGQGMAIKANRNPYVRAALCYSEDIASLAREHNNANILCLGANFQKLNLAKEIFKVFITTRFSGGRHLRRVQKLNN